MVCGSITCLVLLPEMVEAYPFMNEITRVGGGGVKEYGPDGKTKYNGRPGHYRRILAAFCVLPQDYPGPITTLRKTRKT